MEEHGNSKRQTQKYLEKTPCLCHFVHPQCEGNDLELKAILGSDRTAIHGKANFSVYVENYTAVISQ